MTKLILRNTITLVLKVTHSCNLACEYCFYLNKDYSISNQKILDLDILKSILRKTGQVCDTINLVFHGGEPLLLPLKYYEEVLDYQSRLSEKYQVKFNNSIQSNGTILNDKFISFFKNRNIAYGVSLDGDKEVHDSLRHFRNNSNSTFDKIIDNINKLKSNDINVSALVVASKYTVNDPITFYNLFKKTNINVKINEMFFLKEDKHLIPSNEDLSSFLIDLFELWFNDKSGNLISIEPFTTIISSFWGENAGDCCYKSSCSSFFIIETDGSIMLCSRLKFLENKLGNLVNHNWDDIIKSDVLKKLNNRIIEPKYECADCKWLNACGCGCTASAFETYGDMYQKTYWCESRKKLFDHIYNKLKSLN